MKSFTKFMSIFIALLFISLPLQAQNYVHLFQSYFYDAPISKIKHAEGGIEWGKFGGNGVDMSTLLINVKATYPVKDKLETGVQLGYLNYSTSIDGKSHTESDISDIGIFVRYKIDQSEQMAISVGGMATLPVGSESIGQGNLNYGAYGAVRYQLGNGVILTGNLGLIFYEFQTMKTKQTGPNPWDIETVKSSEYDNYLNLGFGGIYPVNEKLNAVGEFVLKSGMDYMMLSAGADYLVGSGRVRGALGLGLDDGAPDFQIMISYGMFF